MGIMGKIAKFFGIIKVRTINNQVRVTGIDALIMKKYIRSVFETDVINKMMFTHMGDTSFTFHHFFIPDIVYILTKVRMNPKCKWSVRNSIDKIMQGILTETWFKSTVGEVTPMVDPKRMTVLKWPPLPRQAEFLHLYGDRMPRYDLRGYILALAPGQGKTFTDLLVASCVIPPSVAEVKIIISPKKALHLVWAKSIRDLFKKVPSYWTSDSGTEMPLKNNEYYIFNYESLPKAMELVKKLDARNVRYFVIVDESHNFADPKSSRTQQLVDLQTYRDDTYFIWTTGTPILKLGTELISFLKCADKRFDAEAERRFKKIFASSKGRANEIFNNRLGQMMAFMVPKSDNNATRPTVKELPIKLPSSLSNRFLMATVRKDMKSFIEERIKFYQKDMNNLRQIVNDQLNYHKAHLNTKEEEKAFNTYLKHLKVISRNPDLMLQEPLEYTRKYERTKLLPSLIPTERKSFKSALSAIKNIKLKVRGEALGKILAKRRSECTAALALYCKPEDILKDSLSKTLFFSTSVYPVETLAKFLENKGFQPVRVFGDANKNLTKLIDDFHKDPNLNPICATMQSLSEAVPVTAASTVVLLNRPFRQSMYEQVVARADRMGQIHPVTVIELTLDTQGEPNVSSRTDEILAEVRMLISELVGVEFAGPDMEEREYLPIINAAEQDPSLVKIDELMGL